MTYIIGFVSQKGGVGKSTLAGMMARELSLGGLLVKIADLDRQQKTCVNWVRRRDERKGVPYIEVGSFARVGAALAEAPQYDALILDGKPDATDKTIEIARASDLVVIPTGQTIDDLHPAVLLAHSLRGKGVARHRIAFAMFKTTGSRHESTKARVYFANAGYSVLKGEVPVRTSYRRALDKGRTITETSYESLNLRAAKLAQGVIDRLVKLQKMKVA